MPGDGRPIITWPRFTWSPVMSWSRSATPTEKPTMQREIKLHIFASAKGGVGKSTLAVTCAKLIAAGRARLPVVIDADPRRLERIIANFLDNAHEHADDKDVQIEVDPSPEDEIVIAVTDRGPGVPEDRLEMIFDRFTKVDPSRSRGST